jgi:glycopeptide antibiotics resistance protein
VSKYVKFILNIIIPLAIGGIVYYITSPDVIFVQRLDDILGVVRDSEETMHSGEIFRTFLRNYFLDMLWAHSLTFCIYILVDNNTESVYKTMTIAFTFSLAMELLQLTNTVKGTFDVADILVEFIAIVIAVFIIKYKRFTLRRNEDYEK